MDRCIGRNLDGRTPQRQAAAVLAAVIVCAVHGAAFAAPTFANCIALGTVQTPLAAEISGLEASRANPDVLWMHNDSGDSSRIYALKSDGTHLGVYNFSGIDADDWEDIAIGPGPVPGVDYLYLGDIGDKGFMGTVVVHRVPEPVVYGRQAASPVTVNIANCETFTIQYPGLLSVTGLDAECLMADPVTGDIFVGSKEPDQLRVFRGAAADFASGGATVNMTTVATVALNSASDNISGGCISPGGAEIITRNETVARLWHRGSGQSVGDAFGGTPVTVPLAAEPNGEAVAFDAAGSGYFTLSEGSHQPVYYFARTSNDGPTPEATIIPPESQWRYLDNGSDQGTAWRSPAFDDGAWGSGAAQLGYGEGDEQTVVQKNTTTYFRKSVCLDNTAPFESLKLRVLYEGGVAVYLNGTEVLRKALASGPSASTFATGMRGAVKYSWLTADVDKSLLVNGENTVAVEVHLAGSGQADMSFDFQLEGTRNYPAQAYPVTVVTQSDPPGLTVPSFALDGGAGTIAGGGSQNFWVYSAITNPTLPYTAFEATTNQYNLGAEGAPPCNCANYAGGGEAGCWPRVTATNALLYKGNATWPAANHFDWYNIHYPSGPVMITVTYKARAIPVSYGPDITGPTVVHHEVTGHSIVVTPAVRPGFALTGVSATSGVTTDLGNGTWSLSGVTDFGGVTVTAAYLSQQTTAPNVVGQNQTAAAAALAGAGLVTGQVTLECNGSVPAGQVLRQSPQAGAQAPSGSAVDLVVAAASVPISGAVVINNNLSTTTTAQVSLALNWSGGCGGVVRMRFSDDGANWTTWEPLALTKPHTLPSGDGYKTVRVQFRDASGNVSAVFSDYIRLDTIPPIGTVVINGNTSVTNSVQVTLALTWTDGAGAGVVRMRFSDDGAHWTPWEPPAATRAHTLPAGDGYKTVRVQFRDGAGNYSAAVNDYIRLDTTPPTGTIIINDGALTTTTQEVTLKLTWSDGDGSGVVRMRFSDNGSTWSAWETLKAIRVHTLPAGSGYHTVRAQYRDGAGNISPACNDYIKLLSP